VCVCCSGQRPTLLGRREQREERRERARARAAGGAEHSLDRAATLIDPISTARLSEIIRWIDGFQIDF